MNHHPRKMITSTSIPVSTAPIKSIKVILTPPLQCFIILVAFFTTSLEVFGCVVQQYVPLNPIELLFQIIAFSDQSKQNHENRNQRGHQRINSSFSHGHSSYKEEKEPPQRLAFLVVMSLLFFSSEKSSRMLLSLQTAPIPFVPTSFSKFHFLPIKRLRF